VAAGNSAGNNGICQIEDLLPSPELALEMTEMVREKLALLHNDEQRKIALYKMQGYTNQEIAFMLPRALRSVERKLNSIRQLWLHIRTDDESGFLAQ
jgi:DNA-directed RNA polymerase specialized sigma24 family protein